MRLAQRSQDHLADHLFPGRDRARGIEGHALLLRDRRRSRSARLEPPVAATRWLTPIWRGSVPRAPRWKVASNMPASGIGAAARLPARAAWTAAKPPLDQDGSTSEVSCDIQQPAQTYLRLPFIVRPGNRTAIPATQAQLSAIDTATRYSARPAKLFAGRIHGFPPFPALFDRFPLYAFSGGQRRERALGERRSADLNGPRRLIPGFDGALFTSEWKDALWARYSTGAPQRLRRSVERYSIVKKA